MSRPTCPRCGATIELAQESEKRRREREKVNGQRRSMGFADLATPQTIRAHKDPIDGRSCWAGGREYGEVADAIVKHRERLREARISAGVEQP